MKHTLKKTAATVALAGALALGAPLAANAYVPVGPSGTVSATPGAPVSVPFSGFEPGESVSFTLTGENASAATLAAIVRIAVETSAPVTKTADASGAVTPTVTLPADASGTYTLTATGATSGTQTATITVPAAGAAPVAGGTGGLAATGGQDLTGLWVGGGALLLTGGAVLVATKLRRREVKA